ncbi:MAG TPA: ester cyclase [Blastocatellia bacterium]
MHQAILFVFLSALCLSPAQKASEQETNKAVARGFFEQVLDQGHLDKYADSHAPDFIVHTGTRDASLKEDIAAAREERKAMPDLRVKINEIIAERDLVLVYWTASGTNTHEAMGLPGTGKSISAPGMTLFRFKAGKIVEEWSVWDTLPIMQQVGLLPGR